VHQAFPPKAREQKFPRGAVANLPFPLHFVSHNYETMSSTQLRSRIVTYFRIVTDGAFGLPQDLV